VEVGKVIGHMVNIPSLFSRQCGITFVYSTWFQIAYSENLDYFILGVLFFPMPSAIGDLQRVVSRT